MQHCATAQHDPDTDHYTGSDGGRRRKLQNRIQDNIFKQNRIKEEILLNSLPSGCEAYMLKLNVLCFLVKVSFLNKNISKPVRKMGIETKKPATAQIRVTAESLKNFLILNRRKIVYKSVTG